MRVLLISLRLSVWRWPIFYAYQDPIILLPSVAHPLVAILPTRLSSWRWPLSR